MVSEHYPAQPIGSPEPVQSCNQHLPSFPQLHGSEFEEACSLLLRRFELHANGQTEWSAVEVVLEHETTILRVTKPLVLLPVLSDASDDTKEVEIDEVDDEVADTRTSTTAIVRYEVGLSPSYRVPVLYFTIVDNQHRYPPTMTTLYSHIIPSEFRAQAEHVGVIGGITVTVCIRDLGTDQRPS